MTTKKTKKAAAPALRPALTRTYLEAQVRRFFLQMMDESASDTARIAAAKALIERVDKAAPPPRAAREKTGGGKNEPCDGTCGQHGRPLCPDHERAVAEAKALLEKMRG